MTMHKPKYSFSFSFGNVATIVCGVVFAFTIIATLQVSIAAADQERKDLKERVVKNEVAIQQVIALREDIIRLAVHQENSTKQMDNLMEYLKDTRERERR